MSESQGVRAYFVPRLALPIFHFATNKWNVTLSPADAKRLNNDLRELSRFPQIELHLTGYADIRSTPAHNEFLARNRAASVKTYLVSLMRRLGLAPLRMVALGVGQTQKFGSKYLNDRVTTVTY
jgi:outer membrane protein OmpA-like peptidoglycan-associated protein